MGRRRGLVILTGFMGTGKTAVGERLAQRLKRRFVDTDTLIERREGRSVAQVFAAEGEEYFREREREVVAEVARLSDAVVATGGGTIVDEQNFRALRAAGTIICLIASPEAILQRTPGHGRPLLTGADRAERVRELLARRQSAYARAEHRIDTSERTLEEVTEEALAIVRASEKDATES